MLVQFSAPFFPGTKFWHHSSNGWNRQGLSSQEKRKETLGFVAVAQGVFPLTGAKIHLHMQIRLPHQRVAGPGHIPGKAGQVLGQPYHTPQLIINKTMSTDTRNSGRRRSRRSGRHSDYRPGSRKEGRKPAAKEKTFWQKIVGLFTGDAQPAPTQTANNNSTRTEKRPPRERKRSAGRKPEMVEVTSPRLYVGNLSFDASESDLFDLFNGVGLVQNVEIVNNKHTMRSKGFGFVQMQTTEEAKRAVDELHDKDYMGRKLVVSGAKALEERRGDHDGSSDQQPEQ